MKKLTIIIGLMCLMGLMGKANGQAVARLSADTILLGDQTTLSIQRAHTYPSTDQLSQNGIVALSQQFDTAKHTQLTTLTSFEPGVHFIKLSPDDSLQLTVLDVDVDTTTAEIRDIAPIEKVPYTFWEIFRWVLLGLAIVALALGGWWLWKKWKSGKVSDWFANTPVDPRRARPRQPRGAAPAPAVAGRQGEGIPHRADRRRAHLHRGSHRHPRHRDDQRRDSGGN